MENLLRGLQTAAPWDQLVGDEDFLLGNISTAVGCKKTVVYF